MKQGGRHMAEQGRTRLSFRRAGFARVFTSPAGLARAAGFTITEVLIVLAVTGMLFIIAVITIDGKQNKTQFQTGINTFQQQLQQLINETSNGFYPRDTSFSCARGASKPPILTTQSSADRQGQNADCIFLGKVIQFAVQGTNPQQYQVIPVIGNTLDTTGGVQATTLYGSTGSLPEAAAAGTQAQSNLGLTGINTVGTMAGGMQVVSVWHDANIPANATGTVGFISTLPSLSSGGVASGSQRLALYTVTGTVLNQTTPVTADYMYPGIYNTQPLAAVSSISICVASGTTNQSGLITIGQSDASAASSLAVDLAIKPGTVC